MPAYRLKPRLPMWRLSALVLGLLVLPVPLDLAVPQLVNPDTQVELGAPELDWTVPLNWPDGQPLICEPDPDAMFDAAWFCEDSRISTLVMEGSNNEDETLRRGIRASSGEKITGPVTMHKGSARMISTDSITGISVEGANDHEGNTLVVVVSGHDRKAYSDLIWTTLVEPERLSQLKDPREAA